jgi:hypothetical protein
MASLEPLIDYPGTYGGPSSREEILRALKEALALVHDTAPGTSLFCAGLRIERPAADPVLDALDHGPRPPTA